MHEHFDADGNPTGTTVVTRESMWDDESRGRALRLHEYERSICGCGCGLPRRIAHDPKQVFKVETTTCRASKARAQVERAEARAAEDQNRPEGWSDGLQFFAIPIDDDREEG